ncbi:MAG: glycoside hydrolase family 3 C-terminal domain-containing protein [Clostridia bacterium]|nr:glycoside hydrolase family 3 C-terminal domain-containing protein [Clostridia bacterium]
MKKALLVIPVLLLLGLCLLTGCRGQGTDPVGSGTETPKTTEPETAAPVTEPVTEPETEAAPAPGEWLSLTAEDMDVSDSTVGLRFSVTQKDEVIHAYELTAVLSSDADGAQTLDTQKPAPAGNVTVTFPYPADRQKELLYVTVTATLTEGEFAGTALDVLSLQIKNGLPQLTPDGVSLVVAAMTDEEKAHMVTGTQTPVMQGSSGGTYAVSRLGIPSMTVNDGPAGVRYGTAVWYPSICNLSSSWDPALISRVGQAIGEDALALGIDVVLGPGMNIQKNVTGGRNFEYSSEDPLLTGLLMSAYVSGMQSTGTGACVKHYAANNQETARGSVSANVSERALREIYLKGFGFVVNKAAPWTVMSSYNCLNGLHTSVSYDLLTGILRGEFGFEGFVMSDWGANGSMADKVNAGNDLNMPGNTTDPQDILTALEKGTVTRETLDECCRRILSVVAKCAAYNGLHTGRINQRNQSALNKETAPDTIVLLKNQDGALPYAEGTKVALFGNGANSTVFGGAGSGTVNAQKTVSIWSAVKSSETLELFDAAGNPFAKAKPHDVKDPAADIEVTEAMAAEYAQGADAALIVISRDTSEGADHSTLAGDYLLSEHERSMIERVSAAFHKLGKKVTVVLNTGDPIEAASWRDSVDGIIWCGYAGQETGPALVSVLTGEVNPNAKLTMTWPLSYAMTPAAAYFPGNVNDTMYYEDIYVGYRYYTTFDVPVAYEFGYGLSYTTYGYDNFRADKAPDGTVTLSVTVTNTGSRAGREIVQFYVSKPETSQEQPVRELCGFAKTALLQPGESGTVTVTVLPEALETYITDGSRWIIDKGSYTFSVGASSVDIKAAGQVDVAEAVTVLDVENRCVPDTELTIIQKATYEVPEGGEDVPVNLAAGKAAWADYSENDTLTASNAVDGDYITRWSGLGTPNALHTWQVDLGEVYEIGKVHIRWESVNAPFTVYLSEDGTHFEMWKTVLVDGSCEDILNLAGARARVIRLTIPKGGYVSIFEFEVYEVTDEDRKQAEQEASRVNVAVGCNVSADNVQGAFAAKNAVDGDLDTRWAANQAGSAVLTVDLGRVYRVSGVTAVLEAAWVPYTVEYSANGETWTKLADGRKDQLLMELKDLDIDARWLRIGRTGEDWFSIYEVMVYGE